MSPDWREGQRAAFGGGVQGVRVLGAGHVMKRVLDLCLNSRTNQ